MNKKVLFILLFKVILLFLFSSEYSSSLFIDFVSSFIDNKFQNPWQHYYDLNLNKDSFPYHTFMLFLLTPFAALAKLIGLHGFFKIPLLFADIGVYYLLKNILPNKIDKILVFYFLNPIIIYAIYIHSQLDIIPTAILLYSIYLITNKKYLYSAIVIGVALATKIHIIIALPIIFFYLFKTESIKKGLIYIINSLTIFLILDLPFLFSKGFFEMVIFNQKQSILFDSFYVIGSVKILLPIASILIIFLHFFNQKKVNNDLLYFYFGILFTATIFFIYPSPAWYVWMIPFLSIYFINNSNTKSLILYIGFCTSYITFFLFFSHSKYDDILFLNYVIDLKVENPRLADISFTFLEMSLIAMMYAFYRYGIKSNSIYKKQHNLVIGIGGDSGVGKTTLLNNLQMIFQNKMLQLEGDGEHKWERSDENWKKFTHLDPKANHIHKQSEAIYRLKNNQTIYRSEYDHSNGKFTKPRKVVPKEFIVISGLHPFYLPKLRKNIDFKIYLDTDETLRRYWKIIRDTKKRGYSTEKILKQIDSRVHDATKYIYPQKEFSDMIINYFPIKKLNLEFQNRDINLGLKLTFDANIHVEDILASLDSEYFWDYKDDLKSQYIELKSIPKLNFKNLANRFIENLDEIISPQSNWQDGYEGFIQFICLVIISEKLKENDE